MEIPEHVERWRVSMMVLGRRLYVRGTVMGFKRSKAHQVTHTSLIQLENVNTKVR
jgi:ribosomal protein L35AE/L33A